MKCGALMSESISQYDEINGSTLNSAVGGGNAEEIANAHANILISFEQLTSAYAILDYGCGIGRTMPILFDHLPSNKVELDGCDISMDFIEECRRINKERSFRFFLISGDNPHYRPFQVGCGEEGQDNVPVSFYDFAYSFSVFTHVDLDGASKIFGNIRRFVKKGGAYYFTLFRLDDESRSVINNNASSFSFSNKVSESDEVYFAHDVDKYAFAALKQEALEVMLDRMGFRIEGFFPGAWRGIVTHNLHDAYLVKIKP